MKIVLGTTDFNTIAAISSELKDVIKLLNNFKDALESAFDFGHRIWNIEISEGKLCVKNYLYRSLSSDYAIFSNTR